MNIFTKVTVAVRHSLYMATSLDVEAYAVPVMADIHVV